MGCDFRSWPGADIGEFVDERLGSSHQRGPYMRGWLTIVLLICFTTACASHPRTPTKADCMLEDQGALVTMHGASWHRLLVAESEPVMHGTHISLNYTLNLDPDPMADHRGYAGLADHARLYVTIGRQFPRRNGGSAPYTVEVRGDGGAIARIRNRHGEAVFSGSELDRLLGSDADIEIALRDAQGSILRLERITRNDLRSADELMRRLSVQVGERLIDPARLCAPEEEIIVT